MPHVRRKPRTKIALSCTRYLSTAPRHESSGLNAFISVASQQRRPHAASEARETPGQNHTLRHHPVAIKDNICTVDYPTTAASAILKDFIAPYDATVVQQLRDAGAVIVGKTNMDEFGMGSHSTHSAFGPVSQNHGGVRLSAGGSSGGSAVAVAMKQCAAALGTDTGGSVRLPAAYCGIVGFKPSYGLLSRWGVIAYANSLDTLGIFAPDVAQTQLVFKTLNTHDPKDPTSLLESTRSRLPKSKSAERPLRIGIPLEYNISTLDPIVRKAWIHSLRVLQSQGHTLHSVSLPATRHALSAYYILAPAEASSNLAKYDGVRYGSRAEGVDGTPSSVLYAKTRGRFLGAEVQRRILLGAFSLSAEAIDNYFIQAQKIRRLVQQDFDGVFAARNPLLAQLPGVSEEAGEDEDSAKVMGRTGVDVLVCPTAPTPAPKLESITSQDPTDAYTNDVFTVPASLAGLPAISIPVPSSSRVSSNSTIGMQILGQYGDDGLVLDLARQLENHV